MNGIIKDVESLELLENDIIKNLRTKVIGKKIQLVETINSTNTYLKDNECENGEVVIALHQSEGRGRKGRKFVSNKDEGIYFSFALSQDLRVDRGAIVTICIAVAVIRALKNICNFYADIKWVNDIFYNNKKLGGILTEATLSLEDRKVEKLVVGIGLNTGTISKDIEDIATSLKDIVTLKNYKSELIAEILNCFEEVYFNDLTSDFSKVLEEYKKRLFFLNKKILVIGQKNYNAVAIDLNEKGELIVKNEKNECIILNSGEISIIV